MAFSKIPKIHAPSYFSVSVRPIQQKVGITNQFRTTFHFNTTSTRNAARNIVTKKQILTNAVPVAKSTLGPLITMSKHSTKLIIFQQQRKNHHNGGNHRNFSSSKLPDDAVDKLLKGFEGFNVSGRTGYTWILLAGIVIILFFFNPITQVPAGNVGVVDLFGSVSDRTLDPGLHLVNPLAKVIKFSTKTQLVQGDTEVPSKEGLNVGLEVNLLYRLTPEKAKDIYKTVGKDYEDIVVVPQFKSAIRQVTSTYDAKALYTAETRAKMGIQLIDLLKSLVEHRGIIIEEAPLKRVALPKRLTEAIEDKLSAEQQSQRMEFVLQKEKLEAERKAIEATGIAQFQKIVAEGVSEQLLKWKGIEATEKLAESNNAKIVVIGGKDGLPLIFNADVKK